MRKSNALLLGTCSLLLACQPSRHPNASMQVNSPSPTPTSSPVAPESSVGNSDMKEAEYNGYTYSYKREGDTTVAMFVKRFLPRDDTVVVGALRDVIHRAYKDRASGAPYLVDATTTSGTATRGIRVDSAENGYIVVPVKEDTGEIHSLTITRVAR